VAWACGEQGGVKLWSVSLGVVDPLSNTVLCTQVAVVGLWRVVVLCHGGVGEGASGAVLLRSVKMSRGVIARNKKERVLRKRGWCDSGCGTVSGTACGGNKELVQNPPQM